MRNLFPLALVACCSVGCVVASPDDKPSQAGVQKGPKDPPPAPTPTPTLNDPQNPQDDPSDQEGATCNDPAPVTPQGWTRVDLGDYDVALPPGVKEKSMPPGDNHIWLVVDAGKEVGHFQVAALHWASSLDDVEASEKKDFTVGPDGTTLPSPLTFTRATHECLEELIAKGSPTPGGNVIEWHHVMVGGVPVVFGCDLPPSSASLCADFAGSFHVE